MEGKDKLPSIAALFILILIGTGLFIVFLVSTPRIVEKVFDDQKKLYELESAFIDVEYARMARKSDGWALRTRELERSSAFLGNYPQAPQIRIMNPEFGRLVDTISTNLKAYIFSLEKGEVSAAFVRDILDSFDELQRFMYDHGRNQVFFMQVSNVFIIVMILGLGMSTLYIDMKRRKEADLKEGLRTLHLKTLRELEEGRKEINYAIHDNVLQDMEIIRRKIDALEDEDRTEGFRTDLEGINGTVRACIGNLRKILEGIPVWDTSSFSFEANIRNIVHDASAAAGAEVGLSITGLSRVELTTKEMEQLLSVLHEALYNAIKHAKASRITVKAMHAQGRLKIIVTDDGTGFVYGREIQRKWSYLGLLSMEERARSIGADVDIRSTPGSGTTVTVTLEVGRRL